MASVFSIFLSIFFLFPLTSAFSNYEKVKRLQACITSSGSSLLVLSQFNNTNNFYDSKTRSFKNDSVTPIAITLPYTESDVSLLIRCASSSSLGVCARSGGHSYLGSNQCIGLVIDFFNMKSVNVDTKTNIATIESGAILGEVLYNLKTKNDRWISAGLCPNVGIIGYTLGGGHGAYEGSLGLGCDSLESLRMVSKYGTRITVSQSSNRHLFWAMCGAGGGQFGIVTSLKLRTASSAPFDRGVGFRFNWPAAVAGEVLEKWQLYDEAGGKVWIRMELSKGDNVLYGWGTCYKVNSVEECETLLSKGEFFNVAGRNTDFITHTTSVLDLHAFLGPAGNWGRNLAPDIKDAYLGQRAADYGASNERATQSSFLEVSASKNIDRKVWQNFFEYCQNPSNAGSVPWMVCQLNLFHNAVDNPPQDTAFPYRNANIITQIIMGGGTETDKDTVHSFMKTIFNDFEVGVYVNYPETRLTNYAQAYWGKSLTALSKLKKIYDPNNFFLNPQPIPWRKR